MSLTAPLRDWLKWRVARKELAELETLRTNMAMLYRWCAEFDQMCDAIEWLRNPRQDIYNWREAMRKKYAGR